MSVRLSMMAALALQRNNPKPCDSNVAEKLLLARHLSLANHVSKARKGMVGVALLSSICVQLLTFAPNSAWAQQSTTSPVPAEEGKSSTLTSNPNSSRGLARTALQMLQRLPDSRWTSATTMRAGCGQQRQRPGQRRRRLPSPTPSPRYAPHPSAGVERIELIRGGAPGIDMRASQSCHVVLRREESTSKVLEAKPMSIPTAMSSADQGTIATGSATLGGLAFEATTDRTSGTAWGSRTRTDAAGNTIEQADLDLWDRYRNANLRGSIQRPAGGGLLRVNALADYTNLNTSQSLDILPAVGTDSYAEDVTHRWKGELGANWTRALGPRTELQIVALQRASREHYDSSFDSGGASTFGAKTVTAKASSAPLRHPRRSLRLSRRGELASNSSTSPLPIPNGRLWRFPTTSVLDTRGVGSPSYRQPRKRLREGAAVEFSRIAARRPIPPRPSSIPALLQSAAPATGHSFGCGRETVPSRFGDFVARRKSPRPRGRGKADSATRTRTLRASYERRFGPRAHSS